MFRQLTANDAVHTSPIFSFHSQMVEQADFKVGVEIDGITHRVYVLKRPHVDAFLSTMSNLYECVLFTASLAKVSFVRKFYDSLSSVYGTLHTKP